MRTPVVYTAVRPASVVSSFPERGKVAPRLVDQTPIFALTTDLFRQQTWLLTWTISRVKFNGQFQFLDLLSIDTFTTEHGAERIFATLLDIFPILLCTEQIKTWNVIINVKFRTFQRNQIAVWGGTDDSLFCLFHEWIWSALVGADGVAAMSGFLFDQLLFYPSFKHSGRCSHPQTMVSEMAFFACLFHEIWNTFGNTVHPNRFVWVPLTWSLVPFAQRILVQGIRFRLRWTKIDILLVQPN